MRLQSIVNTGNLEHEDSVQARVDLWEQVRILREQVEAYRQAGHELLSAEEQQALDMVQCARVLTTPYVRARSRAHSRSSAGSRSRDSSVSSQFDIVDVAIAQVAHSSSVVGDNSSVVGDNSLVVSDSSLVVPVHSGPRPGLIIRRTAVVMINTGKGNSGGGK